MNEKYPSEITDYYERLGIERGATQEEIKKAYWKQAIYWHPDKNPEICDRANLEFKAIGEAYEALSETKREKPFEFTEDRSYEYYSEMFDKIFVKDSIYSEWFNKVPKIQIIMKIFKEFM